MYKLHPRLEADTFPVCDMELCETRLMNDKRFPWVILVPRREGITEVHQLPDDDQRLLIRESSATAELLSRLLAPDKINVAALGNLVPQLHWHVIARNQTDAAWPGPVWGQGERSPYAEQESSALLIRLRDGLGGTPVQ